MQVFKDPNSQYTGTGNSRVEKSAFWYAMGAYSAYYSMVIGFQVFVKGGNAYLTVLGGKYSYSYNGWTPSLAVAQSIFNYGSYYISPGGAIITQLVATIPGDC